MKNQESQKQPLDSTLVALAREYEDEGRLWTDCLRLASEALEIDRRVEARRRKEKS